MDIKDIRVKIDEVDSKLLAPNDEVNLSIIIIFLY